MSRILSVLKNKNSIERKNKQRKREELNNLKSEAAYRARLHEDMKLVDTILEDSEVKHVIIEIPQVFISRFLKAMYGEEMSQYSIVQIDELHYEIGRKIVNF